MRKKICDMLTLLKYAKNAAISEEHVTRLPLTKRFASVVSDGTQRSGDHLLKSYNDSSDYSEICMQPICQPGPVPRWDRGGGHLPKSWLGPEFSQTPNCD